MCGCILLKISANEAAHTQITRFLVFRIRLQQQQHTNGTQVKLEQGVFGILHQSLLMGLGYLEAAAFLKPIQTDN